MKAEITHKFFFLKFEKKWMLTKDRVGSIYNEIEDVNHIQSTIYNEVKDANHI